MRSAPWALGLGIVIASAVGLAGLAQPSGDNQTGGDAGSSSSSSAPSSEGPPGVPSISPPPEATPPPATNQTTSSEDNGPSNSAPARPAAPKPPPPPPPPPPVPQRSPAAVIQALDKVTAETMRFAAPVGKPIRYKNLVFVVKACETTGLGGASPQASAYVVIDSAPLSSGGDTPPPPREVFKGWMFANSPGLNPFQHPIYDAWLISCMAAAPPA
jgi:hypothetical protein